MSEGFIDYILKLFNKEQIREKLDLLFNNKNGNLVNNNVPKYQEGVDRSKDVPAYTFGKDDSDSLI